MTDWGTVAEIASAVILGLVVEGENKWLSLMKAALESREKASN
jgi:hypothetical protein